MGFFPFRIAALYAVFAALWIAVSDRLVINLFPASMTPLMTLKGWGFVAVTTVLLFVVLHRETRRRNAVESRLVESEKRLHTTFEQAAIGIAHVAPDGHFLRVNAELCAIVGYPREDLLQRRFQDITHPDDLAEDLKNVEQLLAGTIRSYAHEKRYIRRDGSMVWGHLNVSLARDRAGKPDYFIATIDEITQRKKAEASRRDSEARLRAILDNAPAAIVLKDTAGRFLMANPAFLALHRLSAAEAVGKTSVDVNGREVAEETTRQERLVLETGKAMAFEAVRDHDGAGERTYMILRFPVKAEDGTIVGIGTLSLDITERKQAEQALEASERRLALALQATNDGLWDWDLTTDRVFFSARYKAILGYEPDGFPGSYAEFHDRVHPDDLAHVDQFVAELRTSSRDRFEEEFRMRHKDGHYVDIASRGYLVRDEAGRAVRLTGTHTDVTELRAVQAQLAQAYKLRAIGQLAGGTAHDFNNLLQVIQTSLELAIHETANEGVCLFLDHALQAAKRGGLLTQQLLSFSRKQALRPQIVRPARLIEGILDLISRTLGEDVEIDTVLAEDLPPITVDPHGLENAILNIALNARAAMPAGGRLTVRAVQRRLDSAMPTEDGTLPVGDYVEIALADTGCGMAPEVLEHAFEPFFTTREIGQGSGLGLSMVYGFAKQSGGHALLDSVPGSGTTVILLLPTATVLA